MAGSNATTRGVPRRILQGDGPTVPVLSASAIPTVQYSTGAARALQQFSQGMFNLSAGFEDQLDRQAEAEATTQGAVAGATGDFELKDYGTIRGRAYNKAAVETFAANLDTNSIVKLNELQGQFWNDPAKLQQEWDNYRAGVSQELAKRSPQEAAAYMNRTAVRGVPAVEQAKDTAYKLTRSEADAALVENEAALRAEIKTVSSDLFSENPERSRAASGAIQAAQSEYMKIYSAVDPVTGKPLYSPEEKAVAKKAFTDLTMSQATLSWFDEQPDKAGAYLKIVNGDFKIKLNSSNDHVKIVMANQGAKRNDPLKGDIANRIKAAAAATGVDIQVHSGGQETREEVAAGKGRRTGSVRHDHGGAADLRLMKNGKILPFNENRETYRKFAENAAAAGLTGIGVDEKAGYIHAGGGSQAAWGYRGNSASRRFLPEDFAEAIDRGRGGKLEYQPKQQEVTLSDTISETAFNGLDVEMRSRITFANQMADRQVSEANAAQTKIQERNNFDFSTRLYGGGLTDPTSGKVIQPLTREEVMSATRNGILKPSDGEAILKALSTPNPETSDPTTYREMLRRLYNDEDISTALFGVGDKLSRQDLTELLSKNRSVNKGGDEGGGFNKEQRFYFDTLKMRLGQSGLMDKFDQGKQDRAAAAYDEYRRRVLDPENVDSADVIANDIADRATREGVTMDMTRLGRQLHPRYSVPVEGQNRLDIRASAKSLQAAFDAGKITEQQFKIEQQRLIDWMKLQDQVDRASTTTKGK